MKKINEQQLSQINGGLSVSLIIDNSERLSFELSDGREGFFQNRTLTIDGQPFITMMPGFFDFSQADGDELFVSIDENATVITLASAPKVDLESFDV